MGFGVCCAVLCCSAVSRVPSSCPTCPPPPPPPPAGGGQLWQRPCRPPLPRRPCLGPPGGHPAPVQHSPGHSPAAQQPKGARGRVGGRQLAGWLEAGQLCTHGLAPAVTAAAPSCTPLHLPATSAPAPCLHTPAQSPLQGQQAAGELVFGYLQHHGYWDSAATVARDVLGGAVAVSPQDVQDMQVCVWAACVGECCCLLAAGPTAAAL